MDSILAEDVDSILAGDVDSILAGDVDSILAGDVDSILGSERSPGEENGNPLLYSCLRNPMDRGTWWATVHEVAKSQTQMSD